MAEFAELVTRGSRLWRPDRRSSTLPPMRTSWAAAAATHLAMIAMLAGIASCDGDVFPDAAARPDAASKPKAKDAVVPDAAAPDAEAMMPGVDPLPGGLRRTDALDGALRMGYQRYGGAPVLTPKHLDSKGAPRFLNRLILEESPYLRSRAHDPIDWFPFGAEAFERARVQDRPVWVVVGDWACIQCRKIADEAFEDLDLAGYINSHYIAVHVDRASRPDVTELLDRVRRELAPKGRGGPGYVQLFWLTRRGEPFLATGYLPRRPDRPNHPRGLAEVLRLTHGAYVADNADHDVKAKQLMSRLDMTGAPVEGTTAPPARAALRVIAERLDRKHPGFAEPWGGDDDPKAMAIGALELLVERAAEWGPAASDPLRRVLDSMAASGLRDHLGGGFHRGAGDASWAVPLFGRTLAQNARLARVYTAAARHVDGSAAEALRAVAEETLDFIDRELSAPGGAFVAGQSGETDDGIGAYDAWTWADVGAAVGKADADLVRARFGVGQTGNFERGLSALNLARPIADLATEFQLEPGIVSSRLEVARGRMLKARARRKPPRLEAVVRAAPAALAISAFARAGFAWKDQDRIDRAVRAAEVLWRTHKTRGEIAHIASASVRTSPPPGSLRPPGFLIDYVTVVEAWLDLFEITQDPKWLRDARAVQSWLEEKFDSPDGLYQQGTPLHGTLPVKVLPWRDADLPAANAVALANLRRLWALTGESTYADQVKRMALALGGLSTPKRDRRIDAMALYGAESTPARRIVLVAGEAPPASDAGPEPSSDAESSPDAGVPQISLIEVLRQMPMGLAVRVDTTATIADGIAIPAHAPWVAHCRPPAGSDTACVCEGDRCSTFGDAASFRAALDLRPAFEETPVKRKRRRRRR